jgi:pyruvate dehydrogenase E2 component (dihydrolipoamide acetyltransferase)
VELATQKTGQACATAVRDFEIEPLTRIQRVMAERMTQSFTTAPHFYLHVEVDARQLVALRALLVPRLEKSDDVHLTFTDLLIYFCGRTLPKHSQVMAQWTPEGLKKFNHVHIGIAVETQNGLVVPVIRNADKLGLVEIARQRVDLAQRARLGKLLPTEFEEGVFSITNLGMYHIDSFDAILNPPQAAILAVGQIKERSLVENGQLVAAAMTNLSLSVDHRVLDGARAAVFLNDLVVTIETPSLSMA